MKDLKIQNPSSVEELYFVKKNAELLIELANQLLVQAFNESKIDQDDEIQNEIIENFIENCQ